MSDLNRVVVGNLTPLHLDVVFHYRDGDLEVLICSGKDGDPLEPRCGTLAVWTGSRDLDHEGGNADDR